VLTPEISKVYTSLAAMLIKSAVPFSIFGIGVVVTAVQKGLLIFAFAYIWGMFCIGSFHSPHFELAEDKPN
jgi:hypothetical protein